MFLIYNLLLTFLAPIWVPWMWLRARKRAEAPNWQERTGNIKIPKKTRPRVWFHAVSVGEVVAAMPILAEIRRQWPEAEIVLSVTTSSGHQTARERAKDLFDHLVYFPIDVARFTLAAMGRVRPDVVVIMETELWMNFLWAAKVYEARVLLVNGRISDRSFRRSRPLRPYYAALLENVDRCLMQTERDAERIRALGAKSAEVMGNCKFDQALQGLDANPDEWRGALGLNPEKVTIVVGSTRGANEEALVMVALEKLDPKLERIQVVHAPRHIESAPELAARAIKAFGAVALRSKGETGPYLVLDTYGELAAAYSVADIAIIGGGFENLGGQNLVQPLALGVPVLHGPHMQNFRDVTDASLAAGASEVCPTSETLSLAIKRLLDDPARRAEMGQAGRSLVAANAGASARYAAAISDRE